MAGLGKTPLAKKLFKLKTSDAFEEVRNWYEDRYNILYAQRTILLFITFLLIAGIIFGLYLIRDVTLSKSVRPFVVEVDERTGFVNVLDKSTIQKIDADEAINRYFVAKYIRARETYSFMEFNYNYNIVVKLMSSPEVYRDFYQKIRNDATSPMKKYGSHTLTNMQIRSVQYLEAGKLENSPQSTNPNLKIVQVRFKITEEGLSNNQYNKIVTMSYIFDSNSMSIDDRYINPVGFQVIKYRIDDENII